MGQVLSVQKPIRLVQERDEKVISNWKKRCWLKVKKSPKRTIVFNVRAV
ncbi:hypothetical protein LEP1GSC103_0293 [Leptospira borgpetersenii serovar Javanica str. UI 09931]|uniref:Uncharacterized protein n=4 Tax=Leptospira borgpetersenii TaxID=174 RepID=M3HLW7_LEPBO|nr:hypothetical protein LEP1GSC128_1664 [Leptospira borgpetersenii str. 200801926]EKQ92701.1 hypothetical protein LEP1GSC101_2694 [Leptospira borgpetersenii str. UI 09149]EMF98644.1 hypothetical protein LEP1GSC123_2525 [Leptospira borgpetersenii str. 200701203]EMK10465.1 hypothetical protein LEP1GSC066_0334 [Leptospira sp. serovar Kenya str. Sh9]EMN18312.1 hypothetical protein LEP1GSC056_0557 [Leptospira borgpetersenii str. Brem 328]EMN58156.1 hypothetical protein LEP1GSC090_3850 [Leptospira b